MIDFRIYYDDNTTHNGSAYDAPAFGVMCITEKDPEHGRRIVTGGDYYVYDSKHWQPVDTFGLFDYLARPGPRKVLYGRLVSNEIYQSVLIRAETDPDFPVRTSHANRE